MKINDFFKKHPPLNSELVIYVESMPDEFAGYKELRFKGIYDYELKKAQWILLEGPERVQVDENFFKDIQGFENHQNIKIKLTQWAGPYAEYEEVNEDDEIL